jgi:hypothetical protein
VDTRIPKRKRIGEGDRFVSRPYQKLSKYLSKSKLYATCVCALKQSLMCTSSSQVIWSRTNKSFSSFRNKEKIFSKKKKQRQNKSKLGRLFVSGWTYGGQE